MKQENLDLTLRPARQSRNVDQEMGGVMLTREIRSDWSEQDLFYTMQPEMKCFERTLKLLSLKRPRAEQNPLVVKIGLNHERWTEFRRRAVERGSKCEVDVSSVH